MPRLCASGIEHAVQQLEERLWLSPQLVSGTDQIGGKEDVSSIVRFVEAGLSRPLNEDIDYDWVKLRALSTSSCAASAWFIPGR